MLFQLADLVRRVRVVLDENRIDAPLIAGADPDTLELDALIGSVLLRAVRLVHLAAPAQMLEAGHLFGQNKDLSEDSSGPFWFDGPDGSFSGKGWFLLPADFLRLVAFRMSDWERTLYSAVSPADPLYALQSSRYRGVCGSPQKPVCAIVPRHEGLALEFFSCRSREAYARIALYIPSPKVEQGCVDISERCLDAVLYQAAALALSSLAQPDLAAALEARTVSLLTS